MGYDVTYDKENKQYIVTGKKGRVNFKKATIGLWYYPLEAIENKAITLVETIKDRMAGYSKRQIEQATIAKNLYKTIGFPSMNDFKLVIKMNGIRNCPVTIEDIKICEDIYGPNIYALKGKSVRTKPKVVLNDYIEVPPEIKVRNQDVELCADILYIQGIPFLATISKHIKFLTIIPIASQQQSLVM